jgi:hypothetical protein
VRDATGRIAGFSKEAEVLLDDLLGGVYATSVAELVDGAGNPRLGFVSVADTYVQPWAALRAFATTPAAGVEPAALSDFAALDGAPGYTELYRFDWPAQGTSSMAAYGTSATLVQQRGSRRIQFLAATGLHGQGGPHYRVQATPSGTGWTVPPASEATSFDDDGTLGAFAVPGPDDSVWWIWDDGIDTRISRVNADGSVDWSPLPALGWRAPEPGNAHLSVRRGEVAVILHPGEWSETRARLFSGGAWRDWIPIAPAGFAYTHGGFAGFGQAGGRWWTAAATSQRWAGPPRITAVAFPAGTP